MLEFPEIQEKCPACKHPDLTEIDDDPMESHGNDPTRHMQCDACKGDWIEPRPQYINYYECDDCEETWEDVWDCFCDDECPVCGHSYSPFQSELLDENGLVAKIVEH